jgi:hypothetical protein
MNMARSGGAPVAIWCLPKAHRSALHSATGIDLVRQWTFAT